MFSSRLIFLSYRFEIGFQFTKAKEQAIIGGDLSNTVIHPFFIYFAQLLGSNLYQELKGEYCFLYTMCIYLQQTRDAMVSMREEDDPLSYAQARHFMALLCMYNHNVALGRQYFATILQTVQRYDIRFVSRYEYSTLRERPSSDPVSEEFAERTVFLSQIIYFQLHCILITGEADDLCRDLRRQFTRELPVRIHLSTFILHVTCTL
jgi:hypothetical protein